VGRWGLDYDDAFPEQQKEKGKPGQWFTVYGFAMGSVYVILLVGFISNSIFFLDMFDELHLYPRVNLNHELFQLIFHYSLFALVIVTGWLADFVLVFRTLQVGEGRPIPGTSTERAALAEQIARAGQARTRSVFRVIWRLRMALAIFVLPMLYWIAYYRIGWVLWVRGEGGDFWAEHMYVAPMMWLLFVIGYVMVVLEPAWRFIVSSRLAGMAAASLDTATARRLAWRRWHLMNIGQTVLVILMLLGGAVILNYSTVFFDSLELCSGIRGDGGGCSATNLKHAVWTTWVFMPLLPWLTYRLQRWELRDTHRELDLLPPLSDEKLKREHNAESMLGKEKRHGA